MRFQKGNTLRKDGIAGNKKGTKHKSTILKEQIGKSLYEQSAEAVDRNMHEFLNSKDLQTKLIATKYFSKFFRAEKKEITGEFKGSITLNFNPKIISEINQSDNSQ